MSNENTAAGVGSRRVPKACCEMISDKFDMQSQVQLESAQLNSIDGFLRPIGGVSSGSPFSWELTPVSDSFLMMNGLTIYGVCKVVKADGSAIGAGEKVGLVNGFGLSLFDEISVFLNGFKISQDSDTGMAYKNTLETLLSYENDAEKTHLKTTIYSLDDVDKLENFDPAQNSAFKERSDRIRESKDFDFTVPLNTDMTRSDNHLAPGSTLLIKAKLNSDAFLIKSAEENPAYKLVIKDLKLYYRRVRLDPTISSKIIGKSHHYLTARTQLLHRSLPAGLSNYHTQLYTGLMPRTVICAMVSSKAYNGSYTDNPYNFKHYNLEGFNLRLSGTSVPSERFSPRWDDDLVMREFTSLFQNIGMYRTDRSCSITYERFKSGGFLLPLDLTPDQCNSSHIHISSPGILSAEFTFKKPLPEPITILFYSVFNQRITTNPDIKLQSSIEIL